MRPAGAFFLLLCFGYYRVACIPVLFGVRLKRASRVESIYCSSLSHLSYRHHPYLLQDDAPSWTLPEGDLQQNKRMEAAAIQGLG